MFGSYLMFHYVRGVPFDFNAGAFDNLNMWEQIDNGDQYTPTKKYLFAVPIMLFLISTHYTHYDYAFFTVNCLALAAVLIPKLPMVSFFLMGCAFMGRGTNAGDVQSHRMRLGIFSGPPEEL